MSYINFVSHFLKQGGRYFLSLVSKVELESLLLESEETQADKCPLCKHIVLQVSTLFLAIQVEFVIVLLKLLIFVKIIFLFQ